MQDLSLKQMNDFGISKLMSDKEVEKAIVNRDKTITFKFTSGTEITL